MMAERLVFRVIDEGIAYLVANPGAIEEFLAGEMGLDATEAAQATAAFLAIAGRSGGGEERPGPSLVHGYARSDNVFPLYAVTLGGEQETQSFVGDEGAYIDDPEDEDYGADQFAAIFGYTLNVMVYAQHPDVVLYLYQLLKQILVAAFPALKAEGLFDLRFSGADVAPDPAWVPAGLFVRRGTLTFSRQYTQTQVSSKLGRAWAVQGAHLDDGAAVGVNAHVTLTTDEEE